MTCAVPVIPRCVAFSRATFTPTAGDFCRRFRVHHLGALQDIFDQVRIGVWRQQPPAFFTQAILDVDGSLVETSGECKQGMDIAYNGVWGYHPLVVTLANTREVLRIVNVPAIAPPMKAPTGQTDANGSWDVFLYELATGTTTLVSRSSVSPSRTGNSNSQEAVLSADGRYVAFSSFATDHVAGQSDANSNWDVFLYDRISGTTTLVSRSAVSVSSTGNGESYVGTISMDGRYLAFHSRATNLVPGQVDTNGAQDVFLFDQVTGITTLVSRTSFSATTTGNGLSVTPAMRATAAMSALTAWPPTS
jgi:hypothetical protein